MILPVRGRLPSPSEQKFQAELHLPHRGGQSGNGATLRDIYAGVGQRELRVVEEVEELSAELEFAGLGQFLYRKPLERAEIDVCGSRPGQNVAARISVLILRRRRKRRLIEPVLDGALIGG
jgi:hypothetical protein